MSFIELLLIAIALSMDAFTVALCRGMGIKKLNIKYVIIIASCFGFFQALMPFLGWLVGTQFESIIVSVDHWVAFLLLAFIGAKMIVESFNKKEEILEFNVDYKDILIMGIATSIDALAVGISFAVLSNVNIAFSVLLIGVVCFIISAIGVVIGKKFGDKFKLNTELFGGIILICIGIKILIEHLFFGA